MNVKRLKRCQLLALCGGIGAGGHTPSALWATPSNLGGELCGGIVAGWHTPPALRATPSILEGEFLP